MEKHFWAERDSKHKAKVGRPRRFKSPSEMMAAYKEDVYHCKANPWEEEKVFCSQGEVVKTVVSHPRAMTEGGMQLFFGITRQCWSKYCTRDEFVTVTKQITESIREQKFTGAAAGMFNPNIIARDLGLKDTKDIDHKSSDGSMTPQPTTIQVVALEPDSKDSDSA